MRYLLSVTLVVLSLAIPGLASSSSDLPYSLSVSGSTVSGSIGGVPVTGTVTGGTCSTSCTVTLNIRGSTVKFAQATLTCSSRCTIDSLTRLAGKTITSAAITTTTISTGTFPTHGAWVSTVAQLANANRQQLADAGLTVGRVVSGAAGIEGPLASAGHANLDHGGGNGHGGGRR